MPIVRKGVESVQEDGEKARLGLTATRLPVGHAKGVLVALAFHPRVKIHRDAAVPDQTYTNGNARGRGGAEKKLEAEETQREALQAG
eukprot:864200-Pleurochrysis_carterae.AAC.2